MNNESVEVGGLLWSPELLSGGSGIINPDSGIYYYTQPDAIEEAAKQGLRLPTEEEIKRFCEQTIHEWIDCNGRPGMLFMDRRTWYNPFRHRNSIFFPALGYRHNSNGAFYSVGVHGYQWSSSVVDCHSGFFLATNESLGVVPRGADNRANAFPVRCILK